MAGYVSDAYSSNYCEIKPVNSDKLDEILLTVRRIEGALGVNSKGVKKPPIIAPKPTGRRTSTSSITPPLSPGFRPSNVPPPRPPKDPAPTPYYKTFSRNECEFLAIQLRKVRSIIDEMIDDDFSEKDHTMTALDAVIKAVGP
uniref:Uncharacterized protein n=1 Tax=Ciona savignyi TaxID=51511 RepID=H2ZD76_CIOSA